MSYTAPDQQTTPQAPHAAHGMAGAIIASLVVLGAVYVLGFRFVVAAGVGR